MTWATCCDCGAGFERDEAETWKRRCLACWKASKAAPRATDDALMRAFERGYAEGQAAVAQEWYRRGVAAGEASAIARAEAAPPPIDKARVRELLQLVHPDKHGGSELAQRVTQWLLDLRKRVTA